MLNDGDGDGLDVYWEYILGTNPNARSSKGVIEASADFDGDSLSNSWEIARGLHPLLADTDNDGVADNLEYGVGSDPLDVNDPMVNRSALFDGEPGNFLLLPSQKRFLLDAWTVEAWIKPNDDNANGIILERKVGTSDPANPLVNYRLGLWNGRFYTSFTSLAGSMDTLTSPVAYKLPAGVWTHVACTSTARMRSPS